MRSCRDDYQAKQMMNAHLQQTKQADEYPVPFHKVLPQCEYEIANITDRLEQVSVQTN
jgi:hypothetical protein